MTDAKDVRWKQRLQNYRKALRQLRAALQVPAPDFLHKQGIIQCFEYTFELAWKTLQDFLIETKGYRDRGPKPTLEQAFQDGLITDGLTWLDMLKSRNLTSHLYDEAEVENIYTKIVQAYAQPFEALHTFFESQP